MADAKRCDRCRNFYMTDDIEEYGIKRIKMSVSTGVCGTVISYDLCPKCSEKLKIFMDNISDKVEEVHEDD